MELAGVKFARPLTHDLLKQIILGLGADLRKVIITQVKDNTYYAELHIYRGDAVIQIDARPSDSIAVALRLKAPIFTSENLLGLTSVETGRSEEHTSELQSLAYLVCRLLLEKKKTIQGCKFRTTVYE